MPHCPNRIAVALAALLALGCGEVCAQRVTASDAAVAPAKAARAGVKSFRWAAETSEWASTAHISGWRSEIRRAIEKELLARGYQKRRDAAVEMAFRMIFSNGSVACIGDFSRRRVLADGESGFTIEAREPGTDEIIWRAVVIAPIAPAASPRALRSSVESLVAAMLKDLPPVF